MQLTLVKGCFGWLLKTKSVVLLSGIVTVWLGTTLITVSLYSEVPKTTTTTTRRSSSPNVLLLSTNSSEIHTNSLPHPGLQSKNRASFQKDNHNDTVLPPPPQHHPQQPQSQQAQAQGNDGAQGTKFVDLTYIPVLDRNHHPHMGATSPDDPNEIGVYVPDVTHLRNNPPLQDLHSRLTRDCNVRDHNAEALQRIRIADANNHNQNNTQQLRTKILCGIYSIEKNQERYQAIRETWGPQCDGFFVASDHTDPSVDAVNILHAGPEEYKNMYQKVRSIWSFIYDNFYQDYDWFHLGGDDMFVMVENLRMYLESEEILSAAYGEYYNKATSTITSQMEKQVPLFLGGSIAYMGDITRVYQTGGPGYTLNKAALKKLVLEGLPRFGDDRRASVEDIIISRLFREMGIPAYLTTDEHNSVRYHHFGPATHYFSTEPDFYINWTAPLHYKWGKNFSSVHSISFHYVNPANMRRFYALVHGLCEAANQGSSPSLLNNLRGTT